MIDPEPLAPHLHTLRRALNGVVLQVEVARLAAPDASDMLAQALDRIRDEARRATGEVEALERALRGAAPGEEAP